MQEVISDLTANVQLVGADDQTTINFAVIARVIRYYLTQEKKALTKFLQSVDWSSKQEAGEALELMYKWQPLDPAEALELLTPVFMEPKVRKYAISRLQCADNEELLLYLLQLVQALRYEEPDFSGTKEPPEEPPALSLEATYSEGELETATAHCKTFFGHFVSKSNTHCFLEQNLRRSKAEQLNIPLLIAM